MSKRERERGRCGGVNACASHAVPNSKSCLPKTHVLSLTLLFALSCCSPSPRHESTRSLSLSLHVLCSLACVCVRVYVCVACAKFSLSLFTHPKKKEKNITHTHTLKPKKQNYTHNCSSNGTCSAATTAHAINPRGTRGGMPGRQ